MTDKDRETAREIIERVKAWLGGTAVPVPTDFITAALEAARADERERCAKVAESHRLGEALIRKKMSELEQVSVVSETIAAAIRKETRDGMV